MLRHEDVTEHVEVVSAAGLFENLEENRPGVVVIEERKTAVATEGDEVVVAGGLVALQVARH